jgi:hypothetical protein
MRIVLSGNVYDNDISEIYFAYPKDRGYKELTEIGKIKNKEVILNFYSVDSYFAGIKDIVLMMSVSDKAVLDSKFQVIVLTSDIVLELGQVISINNLPYQSMPIVIVKKTNRVLAQSVALPTLDIRLGQKDVVLFDINLQSNNGGNSFMSGFTLRKSTELPDESIKNIRLLRKNEIDTAPSLTRDQLMVEGLSFVNGYMHINFNPFYNISDVVALFYVIGDIDYVSGGAREFNIGISSTSSFRVDSRSTMMPENINQLTNTFNVKGYIPIVVASLDNAIDDALFAETNMKKVIHINVKTDHEVTTIDMVKVDAILTGNNNLSIGVIDAYNNVLCSQPLVQGKNNLLFTVPYVVTEQINDLYVFISIDSYLEEGYIMLNVTGDSLRVSSDKLSVSSYNTGTINIKSTNHPRKVRLHSSKDFVNNFISTNIELIIATADQGNISVLYKIAEKESGNSVLLWTEVRSVSVSTMNSALMTVSLPQLPLTHNKLYEFSIKGVKSNLESDVYSWPVRTDFTKPIFVKNKIEVSQINHEGLLKHVLYWGVATDDVSSIDSIEIYNRTGNEPKWQLALIVSGDKQRAEISNLLQERTYFYRAIAKNKAGLSSVAISSDVGISSGFSGTALVRLSNYPNPFKSNEGNTTIYYYLNQNMNITIKIYNIFGKKVYERNCFAGEVGGSAGANELKWNGVDQSGNKLPMGSYPIVVYDTDTKQILDQRVIGVIH